MGGGDKKVMVIREEGGGGGQLADRLLLGFWGFGRESGEIFLKKVKWNGNGNENGNGRREKKDDENDGREKEKTGRSGPQEPEGGGQFSFLVKKETYSWKFCFFEFLTLKHNFDYLKLILNQ